MWWISRLRADRQPGTVQQWWSRANTCSRSRGVTVVVARSGAVASSEPRSFASHDARSKTSGEISISTNLVLLGIHLWGGNAFGRRPPRLGDARRDRSAPG